MNMSILESNIPLKKLALFSSGVGFYEHKGEISGHSELCLTFNKDSVNDVLKSLLISDPASSPTVTYHSDQTLTRTLRGLKIDVHENNSLLGLLGSLKGAEIEIHVPSQVTGRIMLVEYRLSKNSRDNNAIETRDAYLTLLTKDGVKVIPMQDIHSFSFTDPTIQQDAMRALELILQSRDSATRPLTVTLRGSGDREVRLSYVIPSPVWKVSYRLDLSNEKPFLQGWVIVDNDSDTDWDKIELSLVTGKPVSFIQNLYAPYHVTRPTLPLDIVGVADAATFKSGYSKSERLVKSKNSMLGASTNRLSSTEIDSLMCMSAEVSDDYDESFSMQEGMVDTAEGRQAGDQFEYTIKTPVTLARQQSAMIPLIEGSVDVKKAIVFSGSRARACGTVNPSICSEIVNNTGMKLPAGPITVYDGGTYAGDALLKFLSEGEKRYISYGEDLTVQGTLSESSQHLDMHGSISAGVISVQHCVSHKSLYTFSNASSESKRLIIEHPFRKGCRGNVELSSPLTYLEKTDDSYRFEIILGTGQTSFTVVENERNITSMSIHETPINVISHYATNGEFSEEARADLNRILASREKLDSSEKQVRTLMSKRDRLISEQERTRQNLSAAGSGSVQGQDYLNKLAAQDKEIDTLHSEIEQAEKSKRDAENEYTAIMKGFNCE